MKQMLSLSVACTLAVTAFTSLCAEPAPDVTLKGFPVGGVKLMCRERNGWKVDFRRETEPGGVQPVL